MPSSTTQLLYFVQSKIMLQCHVKYFHWVKFLQLLLEMLQTLKGALYHSILLPPAKQSLRMLCFYTCLSFCPRAGCSHGGYLLGGCLFRGSAPGWVPTLGGCLLQGSLLPGGVWRPPMTATAAGGTHPTGMHSCI